MKQKLICIFLILSFLLPLGITLFHSFHEHGNTLCHSKTESHVHAEKSRCDQLHFFHHTIKFNEVEEMHFNQFVSSDKASSCPEPQIVSSFTAAELDRGPPLINVF